MIRAIAVGLLLLLAACSSKGKDNESAAEPAAAKPTKPSSSGEDTTASAQPTEPTPAKPEMPKPLVNVQTVEGMLTFFEGIPKDWQKERVLLSMAGQCSTLPGCVPPACAKVLAVCVSGSLDRCGEFLAVECPAFESGEDKGAAAESLIRSRYGVIFDTALALPSLSEATKQRLTKQRERFEL